MTLIEATKACFRNYATFKGRATRSEFWKFILFIFLVSIVLIIINSVLFGPELTRQTIVDANGQTSTNVNAEYNSGIFGDIFTLVVLLPWLAVTSRRMHDSDRRGYLPYLPWLACIAITLLTIISAMGFDAFWTTLSTTGNVTLQNTSGAVFLLFCMLGAIILNLFWLTRPSSPSDNRFGPHPIHGPNPSEVFE